MQRKKDQDKNSLKVKGKEKVEVEEGASSSSSSSDYEQEEPTFIPRLKTSKQAVLDSLEPLLQKDLSQEKAYQDKHIAEQRQHLLAFVNSLNEFDEAKEEYYQHLLAKVKHFQITVLPDMQVGRYSSVKIGDIDIHTALEQFVQLLSTNTMYIQTAFVKNMEVKQSQKYLAKHLHFQSSSAAVSTFYPTSNDEVASLIEQLKDILQNCYSHQPGIPLLLDESKTFGIADVYVDLELITQQKEKEREAVLEWESGALYERREFKRDEEVQQKTIVPEALFKEEGKFIKRVFLQGAAGVGKTTLCRHLAYRWASDELWTNDFELVIFLPLREIVMAYSEEDYSLKSFIFGNWARSATLGRRNWCGESLINPSHQQALWEFIKTSPNKVLWILDGLDEVDKDYSAIATLLSYAPCYLVTSRPTSVPMGIERCVVNIGLSPSNREKYIHRYFTLMHEEEKTQPLIDWLKANVQVWGLSSIAVNCQLLCIAYQQNQQLPESLSLTQLYDLLMVQWQRRAFIRDKTLQGKLKPDKLAEWDNQQIATHYSNITELLGKVCYCALLQSSGVLIEGALLKKVIEEKIAAHDTTLTPKETRKAMRSLRKQLLSLGVLKAQGISSNVYQDRYEFTHLTFVEYLAAYYVAQGFAAAKQSQQYEMAKQTLIDNLYTPKFALVWRFVAGHLAAQAGSGLQVYLNEILRIQDLYGFEQTILWLTCIEEAYEALAKDYSLIRRSEQLLLAWLNYRELKWRNTLIFTFFKFLKHNPKFCQRERIQNSFKDNFLMPNVGNVSDDEEHLQKEVASLLSPNLISSLINTLLIQLQELGEQARTTGINGTTDKALRAMQALLPYCSQEKRAQCLEVILLYLKDKNWKVHHDVALTAFNALLPYCSQEKRSQCLEVILPYLNNKNWKVHDAALTALYILLPSCSQEKKLHCLDVMLPYLKDKNWQVLKAPIIALKALLFYCSQEEKSLCLATILTYLKDKNWEAHVAPFIALKALLPYCLQEEKSRCLDIILSYFKDNIWTMHETAFDALEALLPSCSQEEKSLYSETVLPYLKDKAWQARKKALKALNALLSSCPQEEKSLYLETVLPYLNDKAWDVREAALKALNTLLPSCSQEGKSRCLENILTYLKDNTSKKVSKTVFKVMKDLLPSCLQEEKSRCLEVILPYLIDNTSKNVRKTAFNVLKDLLPYCPQEERSRCLEVFLPYLKDKNWKIKNALLKALKALLPSCSEEEKLYCLNAILLNLKNKDWQVSQDACQALKVLLPYCSQEEKSSCLNAILSHLKDIDRLVRIAAFEALKELLPYCSQEEKSHGLETILLYLQDNDGSVREAALKALNLLLPSWSQEEKSRCLENSLSCLNDKDWRVREMALVELDYLFSFCSQEEKAYCLKTILQQLSVEDDDNEEIELFLLGSCSFYLYSATILICRFESIKLSLSLPASTIAQLKKIYFRHAPVGHQDLLRQLHDCLRKKSSSPPLGFFPASNEGTSGPTSYITEKEPIDTALPAPSTSQRNLNRFRMVMAKGKAVTGSIYKAVANQVKHRQNS